MIKPIFDSLRDSLEFAAFKDSDIRKYVSRLFDLLEADLEEVDYQPSSLVERAMENLALATTESAHLLKDNAEIPSKRPVAEEEVVKESLTDDVIKEREENESTETEAPKSRTNDDDDK